MIETVLPSLPTSRQISRSFWRATGREGPHGRTHDPRGLGASRLITIHCEVRFAQQLPVALCVDAVQRYADARCYRDCRAIYEIRRGEFPGDVRRHDSGAASAAELRQQNHELVTTVAASRVRRTEARNQTSRHLAQQLVTAAVAERIVDVLETIQVEEQQRQLLIVAFCRSNSQFKTIQQ